MSTVTPAFVTPAEYLEFERHADSRHEYRDGKVVPMIGGSRRHNLIETNVLRLFANALYEKPFEIYPGNMRVKVDDTGLYTYPDVVVVHGTPQMEDEHFDTLRNPIALVEILSPSTESYDRGEKFAHYRTIQSLVEYLLISQDAQRVDRFTRQDNGEWLFRDYTPSEDMIELPQLECSLKIEEIYRKVPFTEST
ncbi:MAG: Uma2 family endonuclease [Planctomycetaceae bacterium]